MKLDKTYMAQVAAIEQELNEALGVPSGYIRTYQVPEGKRYNDLLTQQGVTFQVRDVPTVGTSAGIAQEYHFRKGEDEERDAYLLTFHPDIDVWTQSAFIFSTAISDDQLGDAIEQIQALEKKRFSLRMEKLTELDKKSPLKAHD